MLKIIKSYMMPIAMLIGACFYSEVTQLSFITPYLIAAMLFFTYCNIDFKNIRFSKFHFWLLAFQVIGSISIYILLKPLNEILAQGAMICVLAPTATAAPVIANILGGDIESLTAYSLLCNITIAIIAPVYFAVIGETDTTIFLQSIAQISEKVLILLLSPFIVAYLISRYAPKTQNAIKKWKSISFYLWAFALIIITGRTISFVIEQGSSNYYIEIALAFAALIICISQFALGRKIGKIYDKTVSGGQGLGQKNTILAIWMAQTYLNPISSIGPGAYVLWQNMVNSYQVWRVRKTL